MGRPRRRREESSGATVSQSEVLITLSRLGASSFSRPYREPVDFGRLPETVATRNCSVRKRGGFEKPSKSA